MFLLPVVASGFFLFMGLAFIFRARSSPELIFGSAFTVVGLSGTGLGLWILWALRRSATSWRLLELGRTAWTSLVVLAWLIGIAIGAYGAFAFD